MLFVNKFKVFVITFLMLLGLSSTLKAQDSDIVNDILRDVNQYRQQHGLKKLTLKSAISSQAEKHSLEMAKHQVPFGHTGFMARVKAIYRHTDKPQGAAENVAYNYKDGHIVVKNWLKSPHHLANIRGHYNYTGIGIARDKNGKLYFTQIFLRG